MSIDEIEKLMIELIHFLSDQFPNQAILKGGMELRLIDCPRYTNDLDYVFVPYQSKKYVASLINESQQKCCAKQRDSRAMFFMSNTPLYSVDP